MSRWSRYLGALAVAFALVPNAAVSARSHHRPAHDHQRWARAGQSTVARQWYDITDQTVAAAGFPEPATQSRTWAVSWLAAARALRNTHNDNPSSSVGALLRGLLAESHRSLADDARFVATFNVVTTDAQIAIYNAKFKYVFWRPVTAIRTGPTAPDPSWTPLFTTPRSPAPREYGNWAHITREVIDARVWEGIHFRFSDVVGAHVGDEVAAYDLGRLRKLGL